MQAIEKGEVLLRLRLSEYWFCRHSFNARSPSVAGEKPQQFRARPTKKASR